MTSVKKIVLDIDGKEIKLNFKQAKELRDILVDMWPERSFTYIPYYDRRPWIYKEWTQPWVPYTADSITYSNDDTVYLSTSDGVTNG